ncbi:MAG: Lacal_2735 family protein [Cytophagales bacterium]|nr:Lacal_2735 family protein [Cytophagales bacterium]
MFGFFKKKSQVEVLQEKYQKLMQESHKLSTVDRAAADAKYAEAEKVAEQIQELKKG